MKRPKINWAKRAFYLFLEALVFLATRVFYQEILVVNRERLNLKQPTILVSNHPSTMMDPLNVAARANRYVHFLANAGLFQTKFTNWFFTTFFCFPVQRKKDLGKKRFDNEQSFKKSHEFLSNGGCLYIAAEGISTPEHDLKPLKSGTARIALAAEATYDFNLDLQVLPVGIYYSDAQKFRSKMLITAGESIPVDSWKEEYEKDAWDSSKNLTSHIHKKLEDLLVNTNSSEQDELLRNTEKFLNAVRPLNLLDQYKRTKKLADEIRNNKLEGLDEKGNLLFQNLKSAKLNSEIVFGSFRLKWWHLLLPFAVLGFVTNLIPLAFIKLIEKLANLYKGYTSSLQILTGLLFFPVFYYFNNELLSLYWDPGFYRPLLWIIYLISGIFSFHYFQSVFDGWKKWRWRTAGSKTIKGIKIKQQAKDILTSLAPYLQ